MRTCHRSRTQNAEGEVSGSGPGGVGGPAGVEASAVALSGAQSQRLSTACVRQLSARHDGLVVLQPGDAGRWRAVNITGQNCGETQHHRHR